MSELRAVYDDLGLSTVESYLQSGNVTFECDRGRTDRLEAAIEGAIAARFGYDDVDVFVRSATELEDLYEQNPFLQDGADPASLHVTFLKAGPSAAGRRSDPGTSAPDAFAAAHRAMYVHCPLGYGRTKLNNGFFERLTGVRATTRNWKTVTELRRRTQG